MFAVIRTDADGSIVTLRIFRSRETAIAAAQLEQAKVPLCDQTDIIAVCLDDGGYVEIAF